MHSALFLVVVMSALAVFFLGLWAPFVAMVQVAVYAGAIMVLFLFVIMLLGAEKIGARMVRSWQTARGDRPGGGRAGAGRVHAAEHRAHRSGRSARRRDRDGVGGSDRAALYSVWLFPFEAVSILLLVAMIGAVVMTRDDRKEEVGMSNARFRHAVSSDHRLERGAVHAGRDRRADRAAMPSSSSCRWS